MSSLQDFSLRIPFRYRLSNQDHVESGHHGAEASPGWQSISNGIQSELQGMGYTSALLDYHRTASTLGGQIDEFISMLSFPESRAKDLASMVSFLTEHIPNLRIILAGESNGTVFSDHVMSMLRANSQVYSIQTGPSFWHKYVTLDRTLLLTNNGVSADSFSEGDIFAVIRANLETWLGFAKPEASKGKILYHIAAPGHDYWWHYPEISSRITDFLEKNFGIKCQ